MARNTAKSTASPERVLAIWSDPKRWPAFVEGFSSIEGLDDSWPAPGATAVWRSIPSGRGRVAERVVASAPGSFATEVSEDDLEGVQTLSAREGEDGGSELFLELDYELLKPGVLSGLTDVLFIRRALAAALGRTLAHLAAEAAQQRDDV